MARGTYTRAWEKVTRYGLFPRPPGYIPAGSNAGEGFRSHFHLPLGKWISVLPLQHAENAPCLPINVAKMTKTPVTAGDALETIRFAVAGGGHHRAL